MYAALTGFAQSAKRLTGVAIFVTLPCFQAPASDAALPIGDAIADIPIFDAQMHYSAPPWGTNTPAGVIEAMNASGVAVALVSSTTDQGTLELYDFAPSRFVREMQPRPWQPELETPVDDFSVVDFLAMHRDHSSFEVVGEIHVHNLGPRERTALRQIAEVAVAWDMHIHLHSGPLVVEFLYSIEPSIKLIWAHAGNPIPPERLDAMLTRYPALYADTSLREVEILENWESWEPVLHRHSQRLMIGTDTGVSSKWQSYGDIIAANRRWLARLPRDIAELIAFRNAEYLFGKSIADAGD